jgi:tetratricopeptide (TPR) repeat protein
MKNPILLFSSSILLAVAAVAETPPNADALVRQGIAAERAGNPDAARAAYEKALQINPNHADARFHLGQVKIRRDTIARQGRQAALTRVVLPTVQFAEASLRESLDALTRSITTQSNGELTPNFVIQDPDGKLNAKSVTMDLRNIPASAALQYILEQTGARARHDEFAIVIQPQ